MSDSASLLLVVVVIYLSECVFWTPSGCVAFLSLADRWCRVAHPGSIFGNRAGGLLMANPAPPLGSVFTSQAWPISISPEGVLSYVAQHLSPGDRPQRPVRYVPFDSIDTVRAESNELRINGQPFVTVGSPQLARWLADLLVRLQRSPAAKRGEAIAAALAESVDRQRIAQRWAAYRDRTSALRVLANAMFFYLFVLAPSIAWFRGFVANWPFLLLGLILCLVAILIEFVLAHKALYAEAKVERFHRLAMMLLVPPAAVRAGDAISRHLFCSFHPLAVAGVVCPPTRFLAFARAVLRDAEFPISPDAPFTESGPRETEGWYRRQLHSLLVELVRSAGVEPEKLLAPPEPEDENCRTFCPRCESQYTMREGECHACGVPLQAFVQSPAMGVGGISSDR